MKWKGGYWKKNKQIKKVDDPIKLIEGILINQKGKKTSVELQHEAAKLWAKKKD